MGIDNISADLPEVTAATASMIKNGTRIYLFGSSSGVEKKALHKKIIDPYTCSVAAEYPSRKSTLAADEKKVTASAPRERNKKKNNAIVKHAANAR
jgi:hypothetical protein